MKRGMTINGENEPPQHQKPRGGASARRCGSFRPPAKEGQGAPQATILARYGSPDGAPCAAFFGSQPARPARPQPLRPRRVVVPGPLPVPPGRAGPLSPRAAGAAPVPAGGRSVHPLHETGWLQIKGGGEGGDKFSRSARKINQCLTSSKHATYCSRIRGNNTI